MKSLILPIILFSFVSQAQNVDFSKVDNRSKRVPFYAKASVKSLSKQLTGKAETDLEKVRAVYVWIAFNIKYDVRAFLRYNYTTPSLQDIIEKKKHYAEDMLLCFLRSVNTQI